jgi:hypothetical protein
MDMQAEAERRKRASVLDSEGVQQSEINIAQGRRQATILAAEGEAQAVEIAARAQAQALRVVAEAIRQPGGFDAVSLRIAEQYLKSFGELARQSTTLMLPSHVSDPNSMSELRRRAAPRVAAPRADGLSRAVAQAMTIFKKMGGEAQQASGSASGDSATPAAKGDAEYSLRNALGDAP